MKLTYEKPNFKVVTLEANFLATCLTVGTGSDTQTIRTNNYGWGVCPIKLSDSLYVFSGACADAAKEENIDYIDEYQCANTDAQYNSNTFGS